MNFQKIFKLKINCNFFINLCPLETIKFDLQSELPAFQATQPKLLG